MNAYRHRYRDMPTHGPWRRLSAQANDADIRVLPEPDLVLALVVGIGVLAIFNTRRRENENQRNSA